MRGWGRIALLLPMFYLVFHKCWTILASIQKHGGYLWQQQIYNMLSRPLLASIYLQISLPIGCIGVKKISTAPTFPFVFPIDIDKNSLNEGLIRLFF